MKSVGFMRTSRHDGLEASPSGFLRLKVEEQLDESVMDATPSVMREDKGRPDSHTAIEDGLRHLLQQAERKEKAARERFEAAHEEMQQFQETMLQHTIARNSDSEEELVLQAEATGLSASLDVLQLDPVNIRENATKAAVLQAEATGLSASLDALELDSDNITENATQATQTSCSLQLYQHGDFAGWNVVFPLGAYDHQQMVDKGALNDDASAIKVIGIGCCAEVYEHGDFTGWQVEFPEGQYDHFQMAHRGVPNDKISSINVYRCADKEVPKPDLDTKPERNKGVEPTTRSAEEEARAEKIKSEGSMEGTLIFSLMHSGPGGEQAMSCVSTCRFGETRLEWKDCIEWCVDAPHMRSTLLAMLPQEYHKAHGPDVEMPEILKRRETDKKQRREEL